MATVEGIKEIVVFETNNGAQYETKLQAQIAQSLSNLRQAIFTQTAFSATQVEALVTLLDADNSLKLILEWVDLREELILQDEKERLSQLKSK